MGYLTSLARRGLHARITGDKVTVFPADKVTPKMQAVLDEGVAALREELEEHLQAEAQKVRDTIMAYGYAFIWSDRLNERVLLVRNEQTKREMSGHLCQTFVVPGAWSWKAQEPTTKVFDRLNRIAGKLVECRDPRPDLIDDHQLWERLLELASAEDVPEVLYGNLHGFRCNGARINVSIIGYVVTYDREQPGFTDAKGFNEQYEKWLLPYNPTLKRLLAAVRQKPENQKGEK